MQSRLTFACVVYLYLTDANGKKKAYADTETKVLTLHPVRGSLGWIYREANEV